MKKILMILFCIVALNACTPAGQPKMVRESRQPAPKMSERELDDRSRYNVTILYGTEKIYKYIYVHNIRISYASNLPKLAATFQNLTQSAIPLEYQITWLDGDGFPLPTATAAWIRMTVPENGENTIMNMAKMPEAKTAKILVRGINDRKILVPLPQKEKEGWRNRQEIDYQNLY